MDRSALAARIQEILRNKPQASPAPRAAEGDEEAAFAARCAAAEASASVLDMLGARLLDAAHGPSVVVDRHFPSTQRHGHHPVERYLSAARSSLDALPWLLDRGGASVTGRQGAGRPRLVCFDLETTGLSGGAGTYAFLVGFGYFDDDGFRTRQFFLRGYGEERALLHAVEDEIAARHDAGDSVLVTYNGRAFDVPLIDTRYQMHRLGSPFGRLPHVDMLFPARRLWKNRRSAVGGRLSAAVGGGLLAAGDGGLSAAGGGGLLAAGGGATRDWAASRGSQVASRLDSTQGSCALTAIERDVLGLHRQDDVPGWEIPSRYFVYARTGDASGLAGVLEHNRLDLVSLGAVAAVVLEMVAEGADAARERHDHLALGRLLESIGRVDEAERCFAAAAVEDGTLEAVRDRVARAEALHWIARHRRRARRFDEAAAAWEQLARIPGIDGDLRREALEALAVHHEHRAKNLEQARAFALSALQMAGDARHVDEVRHRLGRLSKKMEARRLV